MTFQWNKLENSPARLVESKMPTNKPLMRKPTISPVFQVQQSWLRGESKPEQQQKTTQPEWFQSKALASSLKSTQE